MSTILIKDDNTGIWWVYIDGEPFQNFDNFEDANKWYEEIIAAEEITQDK